MTGPAAATCGRRYWPQAKFFQETVYAARRLGADAAIEYNAWHGRRMAKNILIFSDGIGQAGGLRPDQHLSNVYKLFRATRVGPDNSIDPKLQVAFYDPGLGTQRDEGRIPVRVVQSIRKFVSAGLGVGISRNIADCYEAIIKLYEPGDRIFLFGFSRGAYTARCVGGVMNLCGVPTKTPTTAFVPRCGKDLRAIADTAARTVYEHGAGRDRAKFEPERGASKALSSRLWLGPRRPRERGAIFHRSIRYSRSTRREGIQASLDKHYYYDGSPWCRGRCRPSCLSIGRPVFCGVRCKRFYTVAGNIGSRIAL